jgi:glycosyltransferase involved in cell wall biosynthesis
MRSAPKVSVILTVYNGERYLAEAARSVLQQTHTEWELWIVDDGSTDRSGAIAREFEHTDRRCRYRAIPHVGLPAYTRNEGLRIAAGEYVAFLDADDVWLPSKLEAQLEVISSHSGVELVYTNGYVLWGEARSQEMLYPSSLARSCQRYAGLLWRDQVPTSSVLARTDSLREVGGFSRARHLFQVEDYDLWLRMAARRPLWYLDAPLILYRRHAGGISGNRAQGARNTFRMRWGHLREAGRLAPVLLAAQVKEVGRIVYWSARHALG